MTDQKPKALQLADRLRNEYCDGMAFDAAKEPRRPHAENQKLRADMEAIGAGGVRPLMQLKPPAAQQPQVKQEPVAELTGIDEYGPMLGWRKHWVEFPVGTKFYTHTQPQAANPDSKNLLAELGKIREQRDKLLVALKSLANFDSYETEYDGRMYSICPSCGCQDSVEHRDHCDFLVARAAIASVEGGAG